MSKKRRNAKKTKRTRNAIIGGEVRDSTKNIRTNRDK